MRFLLNSLRFLIKDKEFFKIYIKDVLSDEFNIPTLKMLQSYKEVLSYKFLPQCTIKPTHISGHLIITKEEDVDLEKIKNERRKKF